MLSNVPTQIPPIRASPRTMARSPCGPDSRTCPCRACDLMYRRRHWRRHREQYLYQLPSRPSLPRHEPREENQETPESQRELEQDLRIPADTRGLGQELEEHEREAHYQHQWVEQRPQDRETQQIPLRAGSPTSSSCYSVPPQQGEDEEEPAPRNAMEIPDAERPSVYHRALKVEGTPKGFVSRAIGLVKSKGKGHKGHKDTKRFFA